MLLTANESRYLDGKKFVEFLLSEGIRPIMLTDTEKRKWNGWQKGIRADSMSPTVDGMLARYGLPHSYLPDWVYAKDQRHHNQLGRIRKRKKPIDPATRKEAITMLSRGASPEFVSAVLGIPETATKRYLALIKSGKVVE